MRSLPARREREARSLASLTGWSLASIRDRMGVNDEWLASGETLSPYKAAAWWERLWK